MHRTNPYQSPETTPDDDDEGTLMDAILDAEDILGMMFGGMAGVYIGLFLAAASGETSDWLDVFLWGDQGYVAGSTTGGLVGGILRLWRWTQARRAVAETAN